MADASEERTSPAPSPIQILSCFDRYFIAHTLEDRSSIELIEVDVFTADLSTSLEPERHRFRSYRDLYDALASIYDVEPRLVREADAIIGGYRSDTKLSLLCITKSTGWNWRLRHRGSGHGPLSGSSGVHQLCSDVYEADYCQVQESEWVDIPLHPSGIVGVLSCTAVAPLTPNFSSNTTQAQLHTTGTATSDHKRGADPHHAHGAAQSSSLLKPDIELGDLAKVKLTTDFYFSYRYDLSLPIEFSAARKRALHPEERQTAHTIWNSALLDYFVKYQLDRLCVSLICGSVHNLDSSLIQDEGIRSKCVVTLISRLSKLAVRALFEKSPSMCLQTADLLHGPKRDSSNSKASTPAPTSFSIHNPVSGSSGSTSSTRSQSAEGFFFGETEFELCVVEFPDSPQNGDVNGAGPSPSPGPVAKVCSQLFSVGAVASESHAERLTNRLRHLTATAFDPRSPTSWFYLLHFSRHHNDEVKASETEANHRLQTLISQSINVNVVVDHTDYLRRLDLPEQFYARFGIPLRARSSYAALENRSLITASASTDATGKDSATEFDDARHVIALVARMMRRWLQNYSSRSSQRQLDDSRLLSRQTTGSRRASSTPTDPSYMTNHDQLKEDPSGLLQCLEEKTAVRLWLPSLLSPEGRSEANGPAPISVRQSSPSPARASAAVEVTSMASHQVERCLIALEGVIGELNRLTQASRLDVRHVTNCDCRCIQVRDSDCLNRSDRAALLHCVNDVILSGHIRNINWKKKLRYLRLRFAVPLYARVAFIAFRLSDPSNTSLKRPKNFSLLLEEQSQDSEMVVVLNSVPIPANGQLVIFPVPGDHSVLAPPPNVVQFCAQPRTLQTSFFLIELEYPEEYNSQAFVPVPLVFATRTPYPPTWRRAMFNRLRDSTSSPSRAHNGLRSNGDPFRSSTFALLEGGWHLDAEFVKHSHETRSLHDSLLRLDNDNDFAISGAAAREFALWNDHIPAFLADPTTYVVPRPLSKGGSKLFSRCSIADCGRRAEAACTSCGALCCQSHCYRDLPNHARGQLDGSSACEDCQSDRKAIEGLINTLKQKPISRADFFQVGRKVVEATFIPPASQVGFDGFSGLYSLAKLRLLQIIHFPVGTPGVPFFEVFYGSEKGWESSANIDTIVVLSVPPCWSCPKLVVHLKARSSSQSDNDVAVALQLTVTRGNFVGDFTPIGADENMKISQSLYVTKKVSRIHVELDPQAKGQMMSIKLALAKEHRSHSITLHHLDVLGSPTITSPLEPEPLVSSPSKAGSPNPKSARERMLAQWSRLDLSRDPGASDGQENLFKLLPEREVFTADALLFGSPHPSPSPAREETTQTRASSRPATKIVDEAVLPHRLVSNPTVCKGCDNLIARYELDIKKEKGLEVRGIQLNPSRFESAEEGKAVLAIHTIRVVLICERERLEYLEFVVPAPISSLRPEPYIFPLESPVFNVLGFQVRVVLFQGAKERCRIPDQGICLLSTCKVK
jgi:hypothetical protein